MKRILVAVDLGPQSEDLLRWARWFAVLFGASVQVEHAVSLVLPPYFTEAQTKTMAEGVKREFGAIGKRLKQLAKKFLGDVPFTLRVQEGYPLDIIRAAVQETRPDLLILGSHGHGVLRRLLLGSVAENIFREASCPTLIVKSPPPQAGLKRVLCPVNFSELARGCADYSKTLAERAEADLFLLQAVEESEAGLQAARDRLCRWHREGGVACPRVAEIVRRGDPVEETLTEAKRNGIELIVVGARPHRLLDGWIIGRTTEHIVRLSPVSVLVVPAETVAAEAVQAPAGMKKAAG